MVDVISMVTTSYILLINPLLVDNFAFHIDHILYSINPFSTAFHGDHMLINPIILLSTVLVTTITYCS